MSPQDMINCGPSFIQDSFNGSTPNSTIQQLINTGVLLAATDYDLSDIFLV